MSVRFKLAILGMTLALATCDPSPTFAGPVRRPIVGEGFIQLPYSVNDSAGNQWTVFQNGMLQQRGNMPVYGQGAMLLINGENVQMNANRARMDEKTGELVFENGTGGGISVTRRVLIDANDGYVRYIDVLKNPQAQDQSIDLQLQTRINFQLANTQTITDPRGKNRVLAWVGQTQGNRSAVEVLSGKSAKNGFAMVSQQDPNLVQAQMSVTVPAGKEVAILHVHTTAASLDAGAQFAGTLKETNLLKGVPAEIRRIIVNFNSGLFYIGDREVLRGDLLDVIELRGGDQLKGTLKDPAYTLHTFYADVQLPADRIIAMLNVGQYRPRQLLVTGDGQVFGGQLLKDTIAMQLSSGQITQVPLLQIARVGYRKRAGETDEMSMEKLLDRPMVLLRSGDRMSVAPPAGTIDFATRYGLLKLRPEAVAAVAFQSEDNAVHTVYLVDGSHFAGLTAGQQFTLTLTGTSAGTVAGTPPGTAPDAGAVSSTPALSSTAGVTVTPGSTTAPLGGQSVTLPAAALVRFHLTNKTAEIDENTTTLQLVNGDLFVGSLTGQLKLDTLFDTITINANEIRTLAHAPDGGADVQIELWDQSKLSGQLEAPELSCSLQSGDAVKVPVALIDAYNQPQPQPSASMLEQIKTIVQDLAADDWKHRDRAEGQLLAMGPAVAPVLKQLAPTQPPEAQQRIESILKQLSDMKKSTATPVQGISGNPGGMNKD